ncbi:hypothetical protein [Sinomicrobium weinanense]|uniref:Uncharacterized protein n=1 Tax=Sinomicrobium weinanense TaxID=2842200 RepID=A0A926JW10_9FLAO|nr:hypothetical protein [Sinomicrobium weinanense]MBC9798359.1 hypothetical protein [Sinomicrobium weinanense]MBU3122430.1 hypothetical protein [Sinomicrobium weinanense]
MKYKNIILIIVLTVFWSCNNSNKPKKENTVLKQRDKLDSIPDYKVFIEKNKCDKNKKDISVLFFEDGFNNDSIEVFKNGKKVFSGKITTDRVLGFAKDVELGKLSTISDLSIKINGSQEFHILNKYCNFTYINLNDNNKIIIAYNSRFIPYN